MLGFTGSPLRTALLVLAGGLAAFGSSAPAPARSARTTEAVTVLVVRHAEALAGTRDPSLSEAGQRRAAELERLLAALPLSHLYASPYRRTQETLAPLAAQRGLAVELRDPMNAAALARELAELPGGSIALVAGHSNTVPALVAALGGELTGLDEVGGRPALRHDEHSKLFVVTLDQPRRRDARQACSTLELRFGDAPPEP